MEIVIKRLTPAIINDFLSFFDNTAFSDNPDWSFCYCYFNQFPHDYKVWKHQKGEENRASVCQLINKGKMNGYLAYVEGNAVGWCNAGPRKEMTTLPEYIEPDEEKTGSIVCFVIQKKYRRKGIAKRLLIEACMGLQQEGFQIIEGYPLKDAKCEKEHHFGPLSLYLNHGFTQYKEDEDTIVVRKYLSEN